VNNKKEQLIAAVTGARGLIGSYLVQELCEQGWQVKVLTRGETILGMRDVSIIKGDINDEFVLRDLVSDVDAVFHCAAELNDESKMYDVNVKGVETLLRILKTSSVNYLCYISSAGVVGPTQEKIVTEETVCQPHNMYEKTKYEAEKIVIESEFKGHVCILRPTNVIGRAKKSIVGLFVRDSWKDRLMCFIKGNEGAHIVHAKDVASAALFFFRKSLVRPEIFFVACDEDRRNTLSGIYCIICSLLGRRSIRCQFSLPMVIPYWIRKLFKGNSLHGRTRFSSQKIRDAGFSFPLGFEGALLDVLSKQNEMS